MVKLTNRHAGGLQQSEAEGSQLETDLQGAGCEQSTVEPEGRVEKEEKVTSTQWVELAGRKLQTIYKHLLDDHQLDALWNECKHLDGEIFYQAVSAHIKTPGDGSYPPKPSHVIAHANDLLGRSPEPSAKSSTPLPSGYEIPVKSIPVPAAWQQLGFLKHLKEIVIYDRPFSCPDCKDEGWVIFYAHIKDYRMVLLGREWHDLMESDPEAGKMYSPHRATCICLKGADADIVYADDHGPPRLRVIQKLHQKYKGLHHVKPEEKEAVV